MHGLVFASLRDYTVECLGREETDRIWDDRVFEPDTAYEDEWFAAQLDRLVAATSRSRAEVERNFGAFAGRVTFAALFPDYYADSGDVLTFLLGVEEQIHELVRVTLPGATPPKLHIHPFGEAGVLISYTSDRGLCRLLEGLVLGTAAKLGDAVAIEEIQCMHRSDPACVFTVVRSGA
ncbi:MAG TPA: heme NO-binding domain-containing protein [Gaiellaceae bacterium]|nr:heme NO-binding domain-containing protein [Gaiellaceae bacterium]